MPVHNLNIQRTQQSLSPGNRVELFTLDFTPLEHVLEDIPVGGKLYFSPNSIGENPIVFGGKTYQSVPMDASGFEVNGRGQLPQPSLKMANVNNMAGALAKSYGDLVGALLTRVITFRQFLDDGGTPDPTATFLPTVWEIAQKVKQNKLFIEWKLTSLLDREGEELPKRKVWKNTCLWQYRRYDKTTGQFDYTNVQGCSWHDETKFFTSTGAVTDAAHDVCGKDLPSCERRFGEEAVLPFGGFPGVGAR